MDRLDAMALFVTAVEEGSLAAAARRHGRSAAAVTRAVSELEKGAGASLLLRSTRRLRLTAEGERHLAVWREVLAKLGQITAEGETGAPQGRVVVTAPELFGRLKVMPLLQQFAQRHPRITTRVLLLNRIVDMVGEGIDVAVRLAPLPDSSLRAIGLGSVRTLVCASPAYLARHGAPKTPQALLQHVCIGADAQDGELWTFKLATSQGARVRSVRVDTPLSVNHAGACIDAALCGHGVIRPRAYQVAEHLSAGRLIRLLPEYEPPPTPIHLLFHAERAAMRPVRALIDALVPGLREELRALATAVGPT